MVTALLQVLQDRPAARCLGQLAQEPLHFGGIQVTRRRADPLGHPPASWYQLNPTNGPRVGGRIPPGVLVMSAVAVEQKPPGSLVSEDDEAAIVFLLVEAEERHGWSP
jgi:hypothetical protein